jgi:putative ABC transport system permease protein
MTQDDFPRPPSALGLAWRQTRRDLRAGELRLLLVAVTLAVAALTAVGFFADRLERGLARDARQLLGGDAIVAGDKPPPPEISAEARARGLSIATTATFPSMARATDAQGGATRLVAIKAVSDAYPLRGRMKLRSAVGGAELDAAGAPEAGSVWVDPALLEALQLKLGDTLLLGDASLKITRLIAIEPDRGAGFMSFAPRVMLGHADLAATGLIQPASRVTWRLAVASPIGRDADIAAFVRWTEEKIERDRLRGVRVESMDSGRPEMKQTLARAEKFLNLVALLAALLAAVAVAIAARDFAERHLDDCAMLRVLGQPQRSIALAYGIEFGAVGLVASALGVLLGLAVHFVFVWLLAGLVQADLPPAGLWPALFGTGVGLTLLLGFGLPPVLQLARVPPLRVIRRDVGELKASSLLVLGAGTAGFVALLLAVASDWKLGLIAVGGFAGATALFAGMAWLAVVALRRFVPESGVPRWLALATRQIAARPAFAVLQVSALSVGLLALVLLVLLRTDLIASWRAATPPDAPNRFVINIQPEQGPAFRAALDGAGVKQYDWYPMIRGRLVAINGVAAQPAAFKTERAQRLVEREFNLSHTPQLPGHNQVSGGRWTNDEAGAASVEESSATASPSTSPACRTRPASPACARSIGVRCASTSSSSSRSNNCRACRPRSSPRSARRRINPASTTRCRATSPTSPTSMSRRRSTRCSACSDRSSARSSSCSPSRSRPAWWCCSPPSRPRERRVPGSSPSCGRSAPVACCSRACSAPSWRASVRSPARWRPSPPSSSAGRWRATRSSSAGRRRRGCHWPAPRRARCSRWRPAGGACAMCCGGRWWRRCGARRPSSACRPSAPRAFRPSAPTLGRKGLSAQARAA